MKTQVNITGTDPQIKLATSLIEKLERSIDKMKMKSEDKQNRIESKYMDKAIIAAFERASKDSGEVAATSIIHITKTS